MFEEAEIDRLLVRLDAPRYCMFAFDVYPSDEV